MTASVSLGQLIEENITKEIFPLIDTAIRDTLNAIQNSNQLWNTVKTPTVLFNLRRESRHLIGEHTYRIVIQNSGNKFVTEIWVDAYDRSKILSIKDALISYIKDKVATFDNSISVLFAYLNDNNLPVTIIQYTHNPKTN